MQGELSEPLTRREREILTLLGQNLSDREIANHLFIAQTTVKWFNRQIFKKLSVENREEAVQRAKTLGLLHPAETTPAGVKQNLPTQLTPFIGRVVELADIRRWLIHPHTRLITLLAPGGMGKTRLALEAAASLVDDYADGVCFVALAGLTSSNLFISTIVETLGFQFPADGRTQKQQLFDALRRKQLLLVLDNFEHLLDCAPLIADLLMANPQVKILVTSRERLNITGEVVYPLTGLATAASEAEINAGDDAEQLFVTCAQRANPHFIPADVQSITRVCWLVQGMPLAIELAAAWAGALSIAEITAEVERSADFLQTTMPTVPERLRSVRAVFEAAWARLPDDARQVFRRLSVFRGGCTRDAALGVTGASITALALLVDRALLWRNPHSERYEIHELLRQYAEQQLYAAGEIEAVWQAHHKYYAQLAKQWGAGLLADKQVEAIMIIEADEENIRQALNYATQHPTPEAIEPFTDLWNYYDVRSRWADGDSLLRAASDALEPNDSLALAKLLNGRAVFYERLRLWEKEYEIAQRGYEMTLRLGAIARYELPFAIIVYADSLRDNGRLEEAYALYPQALPIAREVHNELMSATTLFHLANDALRKGQIAEAKVRLNEVIRIARKMNNIWGLCHTLHTLAGIVSYEGELDRAEQLYEEVIAIARLSRFDYAVDLSLTGLSSIAQEHGDWQRVYQLNLETLRLRYDTTPGDQILTVLANLAVAAFMLDRLSDAQRHIGEALQYLQEWTVAERVVWEGASDIFVQLLFGAGGLLLRNGDYARAVVLLSQAETVLARCDPEWLSVKQFIRLLPNLLDECRAALTPDAFAAASAREKVLVFDDVLAELAMIR